MEMLTIPSINDSYVVITVGIEDQKSGGGDLNLKVESPSTIVVFVMPSSSGHAFEYRVILDDCEVKIVAIWLEAELRLSGIRQ